MALRGNTNRVRLNRAALDEIALGAADGVAEICQRILDTAHPPDAAPYGVGLVTTGGFGVWFNNRKVAGTAAKPRGERADKEGITAYVGFGFPGRFQEMGTIHQRARPFLTPASLAVTPVGAGIVARAIVRRVR